MQPLLEWDELKLFQWVVVMLYNTPPCIGLVVSHDLVLIEENGLTWILDRHATTYEGRNTYFYPHNDPA